MDLESGGRFLSSCAVDGSLRVWDLKKREQKFAVQASCEFRSCAIRKRSKGLTVFATGSDGTLRLWMISAKRCESFYIEDYREIDFKRGGENESFRVFEVSPDGRTFSVVLASGKSWIFETDSIDFDSNRLSIQEQISDIKYHENSKQWIIASRCGSIYSAFFINHSCQITSLSQVSISSHIDGIDIVGDSIRLYSVGSDSYYVTDLPSVSKLTAISIGGSTLEIIKNHAAGSALKTSSSVCFPLLMDDAVHYVKIDTNDFEVTSATCLPAIGIFLIGDDAGRIHIVSPYSKSNYRFAAACRFLEFEGDDIIFDEHGYSISVKRKMRVENISPKRSVDFNFAYIESELFGDEEDMICEDNSASVGRQTTKPSAPAKAFENRWLLKESGTYGYVPQLYDRVVLFLDQIETSKSISNILARHIDGQPVIQTLKRSKSIVYGTLTDIQIDVGTIDSVSVSLKLDVSIVDNFHNMEDDEIPMSKTHISLIYNPQFSALRNIICSLEIYNGLLATEYRRGDKALCCFDWDIIEPVIILGESRDSTAGNLKVRRTKSGVVCQVPLFDMTPSKDNITQEHSVFETQCKSFSKKLRSVLKTAKYQKTLNLVDYLIEGKDEDHIISLSYPITIALIVKRLENCYYRRLDAIMYDFNIYSTNLGSFNDDLAVQTRESVKNILTLIKTHFKPRIKR